MLLTALLVCVFIQLGLWQWHKAQQRQAMQHALETRLNTQSVLTATQLHQPDIAAVLHSTRIRIVGHYLPQYTFLLDNQVENGQAGFHVLTPFQLKNSQDILWVNRGWVAGYIDHQQQPVIVTSTEEQTISGLAWQIKKTAFQLGTPATDWQKVQPVIDFVRLGQHVPFFTPKMVLKLDATVTRDGYVRQWQLPQGEIEKNMGYALQWFGFAIAAVLIACYQMLEKLPESEAGHRKAKA